MSNTEHVCYELNSQLDPNISLNISIFFFVRHRKLKPIDPEILNTIKMQGPIGYAPNPKLTRRNQIPYFMDNVSSNIPNSSAQMNGHSKGGADTGLKIIPKRFVLLKLLDLY